MIEKLSVIVADIDGTMVSKGQMIMPRTKQAIETLHAQGVKFGLSSGRKINQAMFLKKEDWGFPFDFDLLIGMNGGQLWDKEHDEIESYYMLDTDTMREIIRRMEPLHVNPMIYEKDYMVAMYWDEQIHSSMMRNHMDVVITDGDSERICIAPNYNVIFRFSPERTAEVEAFAKTLDCDRYVGIRTSDGIIEFMDPRVNKGMALEKYSIRSGIPLSEIMAFGDMDNDKEMLKTAGWGVCLKNGSDISKSMADAVTEYPVTEDGLGRYLEDHWLNR